MIYELTIVNTVVKSQRGYIDFIIPKFISDWILMDGGQDELWKLLKRIFAANNIDMNYNSIQGIKRVIDATLSPYQFKGRIYYS